jgi:hypothetical protein
MMPNANTWVVYERLIHKQDTGPNAVCEQSDWDDMERIRPGSQNLIKAGIATEQEADRYARNGPELGITSAVHQSNKLVMCGEWRPSRQEP